MGIIKLLLIPLGAILRFCYSIVSNYGIAIILFTIVSKVIVLPVTVWVHKNAIKMVKMMPDLNRIKIKHFGNPDMIAEETQDLYKKNKYHALASIVPLFVQIILLLSVVTAINQPLRYVLGANEAVAKSMETVAVSLNDLNPEATSNQLRVIENVQDDFHIEEYKAAINSAGTDVDEEGLIGAIKKLNMNFMGINLSWIAMTDKGIALILPVLAALSALILGLSQNRMNVLQASQGKWSQLGTNGLSVGISLILGFFVPAGVVLYWISSNLLTILQQFLLNTAINPKKFVDMNELRETEEELKKYSAEGKGEKLKYNDPIRKREREDYKKFFSVGNKHLVFHSEASGFYKYYAGIIEYILKNTNIKIHYVTNDPNDIVFKLSEEKENLIPYYIGNNKLITLMMKMDADCVVMTMPDIETYHIKRSYVRKDIKYIYIPHGMASLETLRDGALDHYDAVLCTGKHQVEDIGAMEDFFKLNKKDLVKAGHPLLDDMIRDYESSKVENGKPVVLIAPSWQDGNIVDSCLDDMLLELKDLDVDIIVRPHPQHVRHMPEYMNYLKEKYAENQNIEIQTDFSSSSTVFNSDLVISDWSGIAYEFAFTTLKPVLFIDTPRKVMGENYMKLGIESFNVKMRNVIGKSMKPDEMDKVKDNVSSLLDKKDEYRDIISKTREEYCYNLGHSAEECGKYIIKECMNQIAKKKEA